MKDDYVEKAINEICSALERGEIIEVRPLPNEPQAFEMDLLKAWRTLLTNWKKIISITLVFAVIGVIAGAIQYSTPKPSPQQHLDLYTGVKMDIADPYEKIFSGADQYNNEMITYIDAAYNNVLTKDYDGNEADEEYLTKLKENINETYANTFLLGKKLNDLYNPVRDKDLEEKLITLRIRQQQLTKEMKCLQQELSYLASIAATGTSTEGTATDAAIAQGVTKARELAFYQQEYVTNAQLINELSGLTDNSERVQQMERIDNLISEGISAYQQFEKDLNQFAKRYFETQDISITVSEVPDESNPEILKYTVSVTDAEQQPSPLRIPKSITLLFSCIGFGLGCVWVLWKYYKLNDSDCSSLNG